MKVYLFVSGSIFSRNDGVFIYGFNKIFTFEEIIFSVERCIVKKKTYLYRVRPEKWLDYTFNKGKQRGKDE